VGKPKVEVRCPGCGRARLVGASYTRKASFTGKCRECGRYHGGTRYFCSRKLQDWKKGAKDRGIPWTLTPEDLDRQWMSQGGICAVSGIPMSQVSGRYKFSLDRIDSSRGYLPGNIQFVCTVINKMKGELHLDELLAMCKVIIRHNHEPP
jgi:predicted RNA-binding Zn-ribbon protein involved in translation (DUF1610 family)